MLAAQLRDMRCLERQSGERSVSLGIELLGHLRVCIGVQQPVHRDQRVGWRQPRLLKRWRQGNTERACRTTFEANLCADLFLLP
jgi:hypothetical protein